MTHSGGKPHTNIGDKGQRYEVRSTGYPKDTETTVLGWSETLEGAKRMAEGISLAPGFTRASVYDREQHGCLVSHFAAAWHWPPSTEVEIS